MNYLFRFLRKQGLWSKSSVLLLSFNCLFWCVSSSFCQRKTSLGENTQTVLRVPSDVLQKNINLFHLDSQRCFLWSRMRSGGLEYTPAERGGLFSEFSVRVTLSFSSAPGLPFAAAVLFWSCWDCWVFRLSEPFSIYFRFILPREEEEEEEEHKRSSFSRPVYHKTLLCLIELSSNPIEICGKKYFEVNK